MLLADIQQLSTDDQTKQLFPDDRIFSKDLIELLAEMKERPWPEVCRGKQITERWLARKLRSFKITSSNIRIGADQAKGYELADFKEAFDRYLSAIHGEFIRPTVPKSDFS
jgi:putative DNA primase/helicase